MNYEVNPRALKRVMAPADFSCPPPVNIELDNGNSRRRRVNIQGELKLRLNRVILHSSKSVLYVKTWYFIFIFVYYLDIYSFSKAAAHAAPPSVSEVQSLVSGCGWAQHNDLMTWLWIVSLAFLRLEKSDTQFSGLRRLWISSKRKKLGIRGQKFTKVHKSKGSMNLFKTHAPAAVTPVSGDPCPWSRPMRGACCGHVTSSPPMRSRGVQLRGANYWQLLEAVFRLMTRPQQILSPPPASATRRSGVAALYYSPTILNVTGARAV